MKTKNKAFTLVELIIVITILAILATIAFISFQGYMKSSRDGNRLATINSVSKGLDLFQVKTGNYPIPENITGTGIINNQELAYVGKIKENISRNININKTPQDPLSKTNYIYGTDINKKYYQIAAVLEDTQASNIMINQTYADSGYKAKVNGNYNGLLKVGTSLYNLPSLIFIGTGITSIDTFTGFIIDKSQNLPYELNSTDSENTQMITQQLQQLTGTSATLVLTGIIITDWNSQSGSLETAFGYKKDFIGITYCGDKYLKNNTCGDISNVIPIATPTCSDGIQNGYETGIDCGGSSCSACVVPFTCGTSTVSSSDGLYTYQTNELAGKCRTIGSMKHGIKILNNIWPSDIDTIEKWCYDNNDVNCTNDGGLYTWYEAMGLNDTQTTVTTEDTTKSVCGQLGTGWHLPSDTDWTALTTAGATGWASPGNKLSGLISSLPGHRVTDGSFSEIANYGFWWSSYRENSNTFDRYLYSGIATVELGYDNKLFGFSVLCINN